jgi:hypothetical protein
MDSPGHTIFQPLLVKKVPTITKTKPSTCRVGEITRLMTAFGQGLAGIVMHLFWVPISQRLFRPEMRLRSTMMMATTSRM